jgi:hypothetical protein
MKKKIGFTLIESLTPPPLRVKRIDKTTIKAETNDSFFRRAWFDKFRTPAIHFNEKYLFTDIVKNIHNVRRDQHICITYGLRSFSFGNWVTNEDRINFLAAANIGLYDLAKVVKTENLGKKLLIIDWGGAGRRGAKGIYFTNKNFITLRRFDRPDKMNINLGSDKYFFENGVPYLKPEVKAGLLARSGMGSFAHEYGHFIDNYLAQKLGKGRPAPLFITGRNVLPVNTKLELSERDIINLLIGTENAAFVTYFDLPPVYQAFFDWLTKIYFTRTVKQGVATYKANGQYIRLIKTVKETEGNFNYWGSLVELWARSFEVYVSEALSKKGVKNRFLVADSKKFGKELRIIDGEPITINNAGVYPTGAHVWQNKIVFEKILTIFANN